MRNTVVGIWIVLSGAIYAQTASRIFTSSDGLFHFRYSSELQLIDCSKQHACRGDEQQEEGRPLALVNYPKIQDKPTFGGAGFSVAQVDGARDREACMQAPASWPV